MTKLNYEQSAKLVEQASKELQDEINFRLSSIYDFADYHNIWLG
ncbi:hypothetical protein KLEP7_gp44 [Pseudaeromonas phage vB_PpeM_ KLEP7]|nr:hypothetical protein KLEP7_gp44 [Pseudaeromonas phage vB_PpeM_ KLEP7]